MALPYDGWSVAAIAAAALCFAAASRGTLPMATRAALVVVAAFIIRVDPAWQRSLHVWDESVHAVVAKSLTSHPLTPTLYERPAVIPPPDTWTEAEVWLHKPPLALWIMAASLWTFGIHAFALRLPSVLLSTFGVVLTYLIGRRVFDARVGLVAAAFQAVNGLLVALSSGRRVADHVDTALVTCVQLGVLAVMTGTDERRAVRSAWLAGVAMGLGLLAKSLPALIIAGVAANAWVASFGMKRAVTLMARLIIAAIVVSAPWIAYTRLAFPAEAQAADLYTLRHIFTVVEDHGGNVWSYVQAMPHQFGELIYLPLIWFFTVAVRRNAPPLHRVVAIWIVVPYLVFSLMATKLTGFIAIAAPAIFIAEAAAWVALRERLAITHGRPRRVALAILLVLMTLLPARYLLEPTGAFERRDRDSASTRQLMDLNDSLRVPEAVIFNAPRPYELMFYSRYAAYGRMPQPAEVAELHRRGVPIFIFQPPGTMVAPPPEWQARVLAGR